MTEQDKLKKRLFEMKVKNFNVTVNNGTVILAENIAKEVNNALDAIEEGNFEVIDFENDFD